MHCPKCGEEIEYLKNYTPAQVLFYVSLKKDSRLHYSREDTILDDSIECDYECPNCDTVLAHDEDEALAFIKGEGISAEMAEYYMQLAMEGGDK